MVPMNTREDFGHAAGRKPSILPNVVGLARKEDTDGLLQRKPGENRHQPPPDSRKFIVLVGRSGLGVIQGLDPSSPTNGFAIAKTRPQRTQRRQARSSDSDRLAGASNLGHKRNKGNLHVT